MEDDRETPIPETSNLNAEETRLDTEPSPPPPPPNGEKETCDQKLDRILWWAQATGKEVREQAKRIRNLEHEFGTLLSPRSLRQQLDGLERRCAELEEQAHRHDGE